MAYIGIKECVLVSVLWLPKEYIFASLKGTKITEFQLYWIICNFFPIKNGKINISTCAYGQSDTSKFCLTVRQILILC